MGSASVGSKTSPQNYGTPRPFLLAVQRRFGFINFDLAANATNAVAERWFGPGSPDGTDALKADWKPILDYLRPNCIPWLNPPFNNIEPFADKLKFHKNEKLWMPMLAPASIGTRWYESIKDHCYTIGLVSCRLKFHGATEPYPKDLALFVFGYGIRGFDTWDPGFSKRRKGRSE